MSSSDGDVRVVTDEVRCSNCEHRSVCSLHKGIAPMVAQQWEPDEAPIDVDDLAVICSAFMEEDQ